MAVYDLFGEKELLQRIAAGEEPAFRELFEMYNKTIFTFVDSFIHSSEDAEEIVQETFLKLWNNRLSLPAVKHPRNYIYTIARNQCYDYLAKSARNSEAMKRAYETTVVSVNLVEESLYSRESIRTVNQVLNKLPEQKRAVFRMSKFEDMSNDEIAEATGLSKSRVKNIIVEVLKHLRARLKQASILSALLFIMVR